MRSRVAQTGSKINQKIEIRLFAMVAGERSGQRATQAKIHQIRRASAARTPFLPPP